jgi:hypothetical protein
MKEFERIFTLQNEVKKSYDKSIFNFSNQLIIVSPNSTVGFLTLDLGFDR